MAATTTGTQAGDLSGSLSNPVVPAIIRGEIVTSRLVEFHGRGDTISFLTPDPLIYVDRLPLDSPAGLADLYKLSFEDILDYLEELGHCLDIRSNEHMQWARELTYATSHGTKPLIDNAFLSLNVEFNRERVRERAENTVGLGFLNGWVDTALDGGRTISVRAFGARGLHIIPGNGPAAAALTILRCAFLRSDCIIKTPSNGPFAAVAIGQTMCEMAPDHPITKHLAISYWRGGDAEIEQRICQPHKIDKIIAWGGLASVRHVTRYIQPGLELIALDPKSSASVIGVEALMSDDKMREAALRLAVDVGTGNQEPCSAARVAYVITGGIDEDFSLITRLGEYVYEELMGLPIGLSSKPKSYDPELRSNIESIRLQDDFYKVFGGDEDEGCVVVSQLPDPVDFTSLLADRTVNIVPVETVNDVMTRFDAYTQTVGVFPESVRTDLIDVAPFYGVQRFVPLGYSSDHTGCAPHDGLELERRMCKWVVSQTKEPIPLTYAASRRGASSLSDSYVPGTLDAVRGPDRD